MKCASCDFVNEKACKVSSTCVITAFYDVCMCDTHVYGVWYAWGINVQSPQWQLPTQPPHTCPCACVGANCVFACARLCINVCDIQRLTAARVTCGNLNEVNNFLRPFHLWASSYYTYRRSTRPISHHHPVIRASLSQRPTQIYAQTEVQRCHFATSVLQHSSEKKTYFFDPFGEVVVESSKK